jgi:Uma2 family endonuclease
MPIAVTELPVRMEPPRKRWTRSECDALAESGVLDCQKLELIAGELIDKMGKNRPHVNSSRLLDIWLVGVFGARLVIPESPIDVSSEDNPTNEPQPDLIVLKRDFSHFTKENPRPEDLQLVVEIADSTLGFDRTTKANLYARAGIVEYWVLDVAGRRMFVHRDPREERYVSIVAYGEDESVSPLAAPGSSLRISDAFPL